MNKENRNAFIANNLQDKDISKKIQVQIKIESSIKPMALSQLDGIGPVTTIARTVDTVAYNLSVKTTFTPKKADVDVLNALVDKDDANRFIYIGHVNSDFTKTVDVLYYDSKYEDIIIIPDLVNLGVHANSTLNLSTNVFVVKGKVFSSNIGNNSNDSNNIGAVPFSKKLISKLPIPLNLPGIASHIMLTSNLFNQSTINNSGYMVGDRYVEGHFGKWIEFISLGSTDNLFGPNVQHDSYLLRRASTKLYVAEYIGNQVLDDILLPRI